MASIKLDGPSGPQEFTLEHAENLLKLEAKHGFTNFSLPAKSKYEFVNDALRRRSTGTADQPKEPNGEG